MCFFLLNIDRVNIHLICEIMLIYIRRGSRTKPTLIFISDKLIFLIRLSALRPSRGEIGSILSSADPGPFIAASGRVRPWTRALQRRAQAELGARSLFMALKRRHLLQIEAERHKMMHLQSVPVSRWPRPNDSGTCDRESPVPSPTHPTGAYWYSAGVCFTKRLPCFTLRNEFHDDRVWDRSVLS